MATPSQADGPDPVPIPIPVHGSPDALSARTGEEPGEAPEAPGFVVRALAEQHPSDTLLGFLAELVDRGHPWATTTAERIAQRGGRLTDPERRTIRQIRDDEARAASRPRPAPAASPSALDPSVARVWAEYRAAMALCGRTVRDAPSGPELAAAEVVALEAAGAAAEENHRPGRKGPKWTPELVEADWISRWVDVDEPRVRDAAWPLPLIKGALSRYALRGRTLPRTAVEKLAERARDRVSRRAQPEEEPTPGGVRYTGRLAAVPAEGSAEERAEIEQARMELAARSAS